MERDPSVAGSATGSAFGSRLKALREDAGLSQEELAQRAKLSTDAVSALERGARTHPYPATVRALADALGLSPQERTVLTAVLPPRPRSRAARGRGDRAGLPAAATRLIGREHDLGAVCELLTSPSVRLVTLTGTGGIGKSRLAMAVAERVEPAMPDGAAFVPLGPVLDEALILPEIARAFGLGAAREGDEGVLRALEQLHALVVLDNLEHLRGAAAVTAAMIARCPSLDLLATSRVPLRVRGEVEYAVAPLQLPDAGSTDPSAVLVSPAAALLVERGQAVRRGFQLRDRDVPAVVGICHRLAGLPLALELAAPALRVLDPAGLLERLDDVLAQTGPADLPPRQQTLRATLDWSYGLLAPEDQVVFRRASAFVGGFSLQAAEAVLAGTDVLASVERLAAHSLFTVTPASDGSMRYGLLEPVAQYAGSLLSADESFATQLSHAEYFLRQAEEARGLLHRSQQQRSLRWFDTEEGNLWAALEWTVRKGNAELAVRLLWALHVFWWVRGRRARGRALIDEVLTLRLPAALRARALHAAAALSEPGMESTEEVASLWSEALSLAERCGDQEITAVASLGTGFAVLRREPAAAEAALRKALGWFEQAGPSSEWHAAVARIHLASARRLQGDPAGAAEHSEQALASTRRRGDSLNSCIALYNLAQAELALGRHHEAREHLAQAVLQCQETRDASNLSHALDALAAVELLSKPPERVATLLGAAEAMREAGGSAVHSWYAPDVDLRARTAESARRRLGEAAYQRALAGGRSLTLDGAVELAGRDLHRDEPGKDEGRWSPGQP